MSLDCIRLPRLLFPAQGIDLSRFAVIACDQFTAQPSYWEHAERFVGGEPKPLVRTAALEGAKLVEGILQNPRYAAKRALAGEILKKLEMSV